MPSPVSSDPSPLRVLVAEDSPTARALLVGLLERDRDIRVVGAAVVAVILTGMGDDGVAGLREIRRAGGRILVQDEETSVVFGMPGAAGAAGLADVVLPLGAIAGHLRELTACP